MSEPSTSVVPSRIGAVQRVNVRLDKASLLKGLKLWTCPLCGLSEAETTHVLSWSTSTHAGYAGVPACERCAVRFQERDSAALGFLANFASPLLGSVLFLAGLDVSPVMAIVGALLCSAPLARWLHRRFGRKAPLQLRHVSSNDVQITLDAPASFAEVLKREAPEVLLSTPDV